MQRLDMLSVEPQQHFIERSRLPERAAVKQEDLSSNPLLQAIQFETEGNFGLHVGSLLPPSLGLACSLNALRHLQLE